MANQLRVVRNQSRRPYEVDTMNARRELLPQMLANKRRKEDIERQERQWAQDYNLQRKQMKLGQRQAKMGMGIEAAKLGTTVAGMYGGDKSNISTLFNGLGKGSALGNFSLGGAGGGGLMGFGLGTILGKGKKKTGLLGALGGAALGGAASTIGSAIGGLFKK